MSPPTKRHLLKTARRTFRLTIMEYPDHVSLRLVPSRAGDFGDLEELTAWLRPILAPYDADPRPNHWTHPFDGRQATIWGDAASSVCLTTFPRVGQN